jgi:hypothetical protein
MDQQALRPPIAHRRKAAAERRFPGAAFDVNRDQGAVLQLTREDHLALRDGTLEKVLAAFTDHRGSLWMLWPSSRNATPKLRALIDYFKEHIAAVPQPAVRT